MYLFSQILPCKVHLNQMCPSANSPSPSLYWFFSYILSFTSSQWSQEGHHSVPWFRKEYPWCFLYILSSPFKIFPLTIPPEIIRTLRCHQFPTGILINVQFKLKMALGCPWKNNTPKGSISVINMQKIKAPEGKI